MIHNVMVCQLKENCKNSLERKMCMLKCHGTGQENKYTDLLEEESQSEPPVFLFQ